MKEISDGLVLVGDNHTHDNLIMQLLRGLSSLYDAIVTKINSREIGLSVEDVLSLSAQS